ncbi:MAG: decaprenyl-phosphate phosphoribosyltransferase [Geminicoccaceae bacterium]
MIHALNPWLTVSSPAFVLMRPRQWVKNGFVAAPLFFTPEVIEPDTVWRIMMAVMGFCLISSAVYVVNDIADRRGDREHPSKRHRPIASGQVEIGTAVWLAGGLFACGLSFSFTLGPTFLLLALLYCVINCAYSFGLKNFSILDVMLVSSGFVLRVQAGAVLIDLEASVWLLVTTGLLALFLALAKRRDDVVLKLRGSHRASLMGYTQRFLDISISMVLGALLVTYLMYCTDQTVIERLGTDKVFLTTPFVVAGVLRYLQITLVEERSGSPTNVVTSDPFLMVTIFGWLALFGGLIHVS